LRASGFFGAEETVVLFNTGSAYKYLDMIEAQEKQLRPEPPAARSIGGIIGRIDSRRDGRSRPSCRARTPALHRHKLLYNCLVAFLRNLKITLEMIKWSTRSLRCRLRFAEPCSLLAVCRRGGNWRGSSSPWSRRDLPRWRSIAGRCLD